MWLSTPSEAALISPVAFDQLALESIACHYAAFHIIKPIADQIGAGRADIPHRGNKADGKRPLTVLENSVIIEWRWIIRTNDNADKYPHHQQFDGDETNIVATDITPMAMISMRNILRRPTLSEI